MDIFDKFPDNFKINKYYYCKKINKQTSVKVYSKKLAKFRNYFKEYYVDARAVSESSTLKYLKNIQTNKKKVMYQIFFKKKIIGQYGIHQWKNNFISLDGAIRLSVLGDKKIFTKVQTKILNLLKKNLPKYLPVIIYNKKNYEAKKLHSKFNFQKIKFKKKLNFFENYVTSKNNNIKNFIIKEFNY